MTKEQQEAERLIELFQKKLWADGHILQSTAKACAAICVNEIMKEILPVGARNGEERTKEIYWNKVLTIITHE